MTNSIETDDTLSFKEFFSLLWLNTQLLFKNSWEFFKVVFSYWGNSTFLKEDLSLTLMYLFHNPYSISKRFMRKRGEKYVHVYGETPLSTLDEIAKKANIKSSDTVFELGSGRGRACFWLNSFIGCKVVGLEFIPEFVERAKQIKDKLHIEGVEFRLQDFLQADLKEASVIYLYGSCLDDRDISILANKMALLSSGTKVITVSYPLADYCEKDAFVVMNLFTANFTWGKAEVFIQQVR